MLTGIFDPRWVYHHRATVGSASLGRIEIDRPLTEATYNFETGMQNGAEFLQIYSGRARVQKLARPNNRDFVEDRVELQTFRVQFNFDHNEIAWPTPFTWHTNDRVRLVEDPADPQMEGLTLYVHGWTGSTNSWGRTLTCQTNLKQGGVVLGAPE